MGRANWSRRAILAGIGAGVAGLVAPASALEQSQPLPPDIAAGLRFRAIKVDVAPLAESVGAEMADLTARALQGPLQTAFASRLAPGDRNAPTLVARIDNVSLGESGNGTIGPTAAVTARDEIEGAGVVVGANGRTLGVYPLYTSLNGYTGGQNYEVGSEQRRVDDLAKAFAQWLPGQMNL